LIADSVACTVGSYADLRSIVDANIPDLGFGNCCHSRLAAALATGFGSGAGNTCRIVRAGDNRGTGQARQTSQIQEIVEIRQINDTRDT
jgi:hypothetical protein